MNMERNKYEIAGPVRSGSIYVYRDEDSQILDILKDKNELITINAARMCGKTSMAIRAVDKLKEVESSLRVCFVDFRGSIPDDDMENKARWWFRFIFEHIADSLNIEYNEFQEWFESNTGERSLSSAELFVLFFREFIRTHVCKESRLLIVFDELEYMSLLGSYTDQFFRALNLLFRERDEENLSILLVGITPAFFLIKSEFKSSFKIGRVFRLPDFDASDDSVEQWSVGVNIKKLEMKRQITKKVLELTGGHPYLTSYMLFRFNEKDFHELEDVDLIKEEIIAEGKNPISGLSHFQAPKDFILDNKIHAYAALELYRKIIQTPQNIASTDQQVVNVLLTAGLIKIEDNIADYRSQIYRAVYDETWIKQTRTVLGEAKTQTQVYLPLYLQDRNKPKILLINAGGTIGMIERNNKITAPSHEDEFFRMYPDINFFADITYFPLNIKDGANIFPYDWGAIAKTIYDKRNENYDGMVIALGTDTMQYAASAVAFALGEGLQFPVVFVGAQSPHTAFHGDAQINLCRAIRVASEKIPEVVICFNDKVFRAVRAQKVSDYDFEGFVSPTLDPLATIKESITVRKDLILKKAIGRIKLVNKFEDRVLQIGQYPGLRVEYFNKIIKEKNIKGIVIESLGIGNVPTEGDDYNLIPFIEEAVGQNIPVVITSKYPITPEFIHKYLPAMAPLQVGAIHAQNMVGSTALAKLMWLLPQIEKDIRNGDLIENKKLEELKSLMEYSFVGEVDSYENHFN